jgi:hypothetical protein
MPSTKPKDTPQNLESAIEAELLLSPLSGTAFHLYRTIADLTRDVGPIKLTTILKRRFAGSKVDLHKVRRGTIFPHKEPDEYVNAGMSRSEMDALYDPGVAGEPKVPRVVERLPTSEQFVGATTLVLHDIETAEKAKRSQEIGSDVEALRLAILGLRLGDFQLSELALGKVQTRSGIADLVRARLMCETGWSTFAGVFHPETKKTTIGEHNALVMARALFKTFQIDSS